jgi:hypothetical protein
MARVFRRCSDKLILGRGCFHAGSVSPFLHLKKVPMKITIKVNRLSPRTLGGALREARERQSATDIRLLLTRSSPREAAEALAEFDEWHREFFLGFLPWCRARAIRHRLAMRANRLLLEAN